MFTCIHQPKKTKIIKSFLMRHILNFTNVMELDLCMVRKKYCLNLISVDFQFQYKLQMKIKKIILYKLITGDFKSGLIQMYDITKE